MVAVALLTHRVRVPAKDEIPRHQRFYYLELLKRAGIIHEYPENVDAMLTGSEQASEQGRVVFENHRLHSPVIS